MCASDMGVVTATHGAPAFPSTAYAMRHESCAQEVHGADQAGHLSIGARQIGRPEEDVSTSSCFAAGVPVCPGGRLAACLCILQSVGHQRRNG